MWRLCFHASQFVCPRGCEEGAGTQIYWLHTSLMALTARFIGWWSQGDECSVQIWEATWGLKQKPPLKPFEKLFGTLRMKTEAPMSAYNGHLCIRPLVGDNDDFTIKAMTKDCRNHLLREATIAGTMKRISKAIATKAIPMVCKAIYWRSN